MSSQNAYKVGDTSGQNPLVSVVLPVYNGEKYIRQAIISILDQDYENLELILIDDGSTDNTRTLYSDINDQRLLVTRFETNRGLVESLNTGLIKSKGKYIARMDSDDISFPNRIAEQVKFMENNPQTGVLGTSIIADRNGKKVRLPVPTESNKIKANLLFRNSINHPTVMIRKKLLEISKCTYRNSAIHAEDLDLWIRLAQFTEFANLDEALVMYRVHSDQVSSTQSLKQRETIIHIQEKLLRDLKVDFSPDELNLQVSLFYREFRLSKEYLSAIAAWLQKVINANTQSKFFDQSALQEAVGYLWFLACTTLASDGIRTSGIYKQHELSNYFKPKFSTRLRFLIKNLYLKK